MNEMFAEIRQKLDELQAEVERLKAENTELRKQLAQYETANVSKTPETAVDENDVEKMKDYVYNLAHALIDHTAENEVSVITELMEFWKSNKPASGVPTIALKLVLDAQCLSEECANVIYDVIMSYDVKVTGRLRKVKPIPEKYHNLAENVVTKVDSLSDDKVEKLLNLTFEKYSNKYRFRGENYIRLIGDCNNTLYKRFANSNNYKVERKSDTWYRVERA